MSAGDGKACLAPGTAYRWRVLWAAFFSYLADSYDLIVLAIAMPVLLKVLAISLPEGGLLGSATMLGAIAGSVVFGLLAENRGSRFALILSLVWLGAGMAAVVLVSSWGQWMALRFLTGLAIGGLWGPCSALVAEHWAPAFRARAASFVYSSFAVGAIVASLAGKLVLGPCWRLLFLAGACSIPLALVVALLVPKGKGAAGGARKSAERSVGVGAIFGKPLILTTILATLVSFFNLAGYWGVAYWVPTFLVMERGLSLSAMADFSLFMYAGMFAGFQLFGMLADKAGRRPAMMAAFLLVSLSVAVFLVSRNRFFLFFWGGVVGVGVSGVAAAVGAYYAELFPEHLRAYAGGFCWNAGRIGAVLAPYTIGYIGKAHGLTTGLAITCIINLMGIVVLCFLPETLERNRTEEVTSWKT
jgi:MFS family permease